MKRNTTVRNEARIRRRKHQPHGLIDPAYRLPHAELHHEPVIRSRGAYRRIKPVWEAAAATVLLVVTLPIMVIAGILVRLTSKGPALYVQERTGLFGQTFRMFKIRTMIDNCESLTGPRWAMPDDPRVTRVGEFLRATHIDELPQLWNVLRGDMSLIGPRPERPEIIERLEVELPDYRDRLAVRPGITGLAQVQLPPDTDTSSVADKLVLDKAYVQAMTAGLDVRVMICTALRALGVPPHRCRFMLGRAVPEGFKPGEAIRKYAGRREVA